MKIRLKSPWPPGDQLIQTSAVESLAKQFPGQYEVEIDCPYPQLWEHNPNVKKFAHDEPMVKDIQIGFELINLSGQVPVHGLAACIPPIRKALGIDLTLQVKRPYVYLTEEETKWENQVATETGYRGRYWLLCSNYQRGYTTKHWPFKYWQKVIDAFKGRIQFVQCGTLNDYYERHDGVIDMLGMTDLRQWLRLAYHCQGILCQVSFPWWTAMAWQKPAVCVSSGMESPYWTNYDLGIKLSRHGQMECCRWGGCGRGKTIPLADGSREDNKPDGLCLQPVFGDDPHPRCMASISPEEVIYSIESYYRNGALNY